MDKVLVVKGNQKQMQNQKILNQKVSFNKIFINFELFLKRNRR